jgi:TolB-like protein/Flp pilus assembly protein TadD
VRNAAARAHAERALKLAPDSVEALFALARWQRDGEEPAIAEASFLKILARNPDHVGALHNLGYLYDRLDRIDEAAALYAREAQNPSAAALAGFTEYLMYFRRARFAEAEQAVRKSIAVEPSSNAQSGLAMLLLTWKGDAEGAAGAVASGPATIRREHRPIWVTALVHLCRRKPDETLRVLDRLADEFILDNWYTGPKTYFVGLAHAQAGREAAARVAWEAGLALVDQRLRNTPADFQLRLARGELLAWLGREAEALEEVRTIEQLTSRERTWIASPVRIYAALGRADDAMKLIEQQLQFTREHRNLGWPLTPALLRLDPRWDKIRADPRFQALCAEPALKTEVSAPIDQKSVAVLAFANLSDDKGNEYFSDGISEELLNVLAKIPGLKVSARTSAFYFKGKEVPVPEIAKQLGVAYVVEGSVRKQGGQVRITAQLIKAADGFHVWSDTFTRDLKDIFAVQDEIAGLIAKNLELKMGITAARPTIDLEAYQEYLTGRALFAKAGNGDLLEAVKHFEKAVAIEPKFTAAWVQLAGAHTRLGRWGGTPTLQAWAAARAAIDQARALEPDSPDVLLALGWILRTADWNWRGAEQAFRRTLQLQPNQPDALAGAAVLLFNIGKTEEAYRLGQQAVQLDPLNAATQIDLSIMFYLNKNWTEAERTARRALQLAPGGASYHSILAWSLIGQQRYAEAEAEIAQDSDGIDRTNAKGLLAIARGQEKVAREQLARLEGYTGIDGDLADLQQSIAWLCAYLGEKDRAFAALERGAASRDPSMAWLINSWYLEPLYSDPRWPVLVRKMGLADEQLK